MSFLPVEKSVEKPIKISPVTDKHIQLAKHCLLFREIDEATLGRLPTVCEIIELQADEILMSLGQTNDYLYLVLEGELEIHTSNSKHHHHVKLRSGECVGEMSLLDGKPVSAAVSAAKESTLLRIGQKELWTLIDNSHSIARNLFYILSRRLRDVNKAVNAAIEQSAYFEKAAYLDSLTSIHNRRWLDKALQREVERCQKNSEPLSFAFVDIDYFKKFNDEYGHLAGDIALRTVAQALVEMLRPTDLLARYGGEEFAILFPAADIDVAASIAKRVCSAIAELELKNYDGKPLSTVTLSIGLTSMRENEAIEVFVDRADKALYQAKQKGRNRVISG